jgi:hypothetical protein
MFLASLIASRIGHLKRHWTLHWPSETQIYMSCSLLGLKHIDQWDGRGSPETIWCTWFPLLQITAITLSFVDKIFSLGSLPVRKVPEVRYQVDSLHKLTGLKARVFLDLVEFLQRFCNLFGIYQLWNSFFSVIWVGMAVVWINWFHERGVQRVGFQSVVQVLDLRCPGTVPRVVLD